MTERTLTRRTLLATGGSLAGLGYVGFTLWGSDDATGSRGFTAGTAPRGSDPLLLVRPEKTRTAPAAAAVATSLLADAGFDGIPDAVRAALVDGTADTALPRKVVAVGSNEAAGAAAIAWGDWTEDVVVELVDTASGTAPTSREYGGRTVHIAGETAGTALADGVVALGTERLVQAVVDVWHGDGDPVANAVLHPFDRTAQTAPVRFATTGFAFHSGATGARTAAYEPVVNTSVDVTVDDGAATVETTYEVDAGDATGPLVTALERDLGLVEEGDPVEPALPRGIRGDLTVVPGPAVVTVQYRAAAGSVADHVDDVLTTLAAVTAGRGDAAATGD